MSAGYHGGRWPAEDGGPTRSQSSSGAFRDWSPATASVSSREAAGATMLVWRDPGELYLLGHTAGEEALAWVERIDPVTLEPLGRSAELPGGPAWPGGIAAHADGALDGAGLVLDDQFTPRYRTLAGQTLGWDAVLAMGAAWFLDDGAGTECYAGTFRGQGISTSPLHLVRVGLDDASVRLTEVSGLRGGLVANPPLVDPTRRLVVAYDSGNGALAAFDVDTEGDTTLRWRVEQDHGPHLLLDPEQGLVLTADHDAERWMEQLVVRDIETGTEQTRLDSGSALHSVLFPTPGDRCVYLCSFSTVSRPGW